MSDVTGHGWRAEDSGEFSAGVSVRGPGMCRRDNGEIDKQSHITGIG